MDVTQTFVIPSKWTVGCFNSRRKPPFIDPTAFPPERIDIVRMQFQPSAWNQECARNPAGFEPEDSLSGFNSGYNLRLVQHAYSLKSKFALPIYQKKIRGARIAILA